MMTGRNTKLTASVETYFDDLRRVRASGGSTGERSSYGPLANLLNAVGVTLKPKVFCVGELADQGAGHPDFGLYAAKQVQKGRPREEQMPERGVVEVKTVEDDAWLTAAGDQVSRYWGRYRLVLVTNTRDFVLGLSAAGAGGQIAQGPGPEFYTMEWTSNGPRSNLESGLVPGGRSRGMVGTIPAKVGHAIWDHAARSRRPGSLSVPSACR